MNFSIKTILPVIALVSILSFTLASCKSTKSSAVAPAPVTTISATEGNLKTATKAEPNSKLYEKAQARPTNIQLDKSNVRQIQVSTPEAQKVILKKEITAEPTK